MISRQVKSFFMVVWVMNDVEHTCPYLSPIPYPLSLIFSVDVIITPFHPPLYNLLTEILQNGGGKGLRIGP